MQARGGLGRPPGCHPARPSPSLLLRTPRQPALARPWELLRRSVPGPAIRCRAAAVWERGAHILDQAEEEPLRDFHVGAPYGVLCLAAGALGGAPLVGAAGAACLLASWQSWQRWRQGRAFAGFLHAFVGALMMVAYELGGLAAVPAPHPLLRLLLPATVAASALYGFAAGAGRGAAPLAWPSRRGGSSSSSSSSSNWVGSGSGGGGAKPQGDGGSSGGEEDGSDKRPKQGRVAEAASTTAGPSLRQAAAASAAAPMPPATNLLSASAMSSHGSVASGAAPLEHSSSHATPGAGPAAAALAAAAAPLAAAAAATAAVSSAAANPAAGATSGAPAPVPAPAALGLLPPSATAAVAEAFAAGGLAEAEAIVGRTVALHWGGDHCSLDESDQAIIDHAVHAAFEQELVTMNELVAQAVGDKMDNVTEIVAQAVEQEMGNVNEVVAQAVEQAVEQAIIESNFHFDVKANFNTLIVITGVILYWRGIWTAWDVLFGYGVWSEVAAIGIGLGIMLVFRLLKIPLAEGFPSG